MFPIVVYSRCSPLEWQELTDNQLYIYFRSTFLKTSIDIRICDQAISLLKSDRLSKTAEYENILPGNPNIFYHLLKHVFFFQLSFFRYLKEQNTNFIKCKSGYRKLVYHLSKSGYRKLVYHLSKSDYRKLVYHLSSPPFFVEFVLLNILFSV